MKTNRRSTLDQRRIIERQLAAWVPLRHHGRPPSGWLRAIRGALGLTTRQMAARMKADQPSVVRLEQREAAGKVTLESLRRAADAMNCELIYAVVPKAPHESLDEILNERCRALARRLVRGVAHSMRLEAQSIDAQASEAQIEQLAHDLKRSLDPRIWE